MLWFGKRAEAEGGRDLIRPAELEVAFDARLLAAKLARLMEHAGEHGGIEPFLEALRRKQALFAEALAPERMVSLDSGTMDTLLETVFPARRKLPAVLDELGPERVREAVRDLLHGEAPLAERMGRFVALVPEDRTKARRAARDLAAELLHFRDPVRYPLMTRWVWDSGTGTGALRELIRGNDTLREIPLDGAPETYEAARVWLAGRLREEGYYKELALPIDLVLAQAYADYVEIMAKGVGMLAAELGTSGTHAMELVTKLLGIDPPRRSGASRLKRPRLH